MKDDELINRILVNQDKHTEDLTEIKVTLAQQAGTLSRQEVSLNEHMKRSLANEQAIEILKTEFKPVRDHVLKVDIALKVISKIATISYKVVGILGSVGLVDLIIKKLFFR